MNNPAPFDPTDSESRLRVINQELSALFCMPPLALTEGASLAMQDSLWVWGVLGGKDVGKTTLINALAGGLIVDPGETIGEGTNRPTAYLTAEDLARAQSRFAGCPASSCAFAASAPASMSGLVLVDLPDFDSLYAHHVEQVRDISRVLDGIIWLTTPKKLGDATAIRELRGVLKDRGNFLHVVNKMDWLIAQADGDPAAEIDRARKALERQADATGLGNGHHRAFLIAAKHPDAASIVSAIRQQRASGHGTQEHGAVAVLPEIDDPTRRMADLLAGQFNELRTALTTPPSSEFAAAHKQANLAVQTQRQAREMIAHFQPDRLQARLDRTCDPQAIREMINPWLAESSIARIMRRILSADRLRAEWTAQLFEQRILAWSLLPILAMPILAVFRLLGVIVRRVGSALPQFGGSDQDPFRMDGVDVDERVAACVNRLATDLGRLPEPIRQAMPDPESLTRRLRADVLAMADELTRSAGEPLLNRRPSMLSGAFRRLLPIGVLLWFPFVQPMLSTWLARPANRSWLGMDTATDVVQMLSASTVLTGLAASVAVLSLIVATIYAGAARRAGQAADDLQEAGSQSACEALIDAFARALTAPLRSVHEQITNHAQSLERLAGRPAKGLLDDDRASASTAIASGQ